MLLLCKLETISSSIYEIGGCYENEISENTTLISLRVVFQLYDI